MPRSIQPVRPNPFKRCSSISVESISVVSGQWSVVSRFSFSTDHRPLTTDHYSNKHFSRIKNAERVERAFDALHRFDGRRVDRHLKIRRFDVADAVLAANRAAKLDGNAESFTHGLACTSHSFLVFSVAHEVDVDI